MRATKEELAEILREFPTWADAAVTYKRERVRAVEALEEARKTFATLVGMNPANSLWPRGARVGLEDVQAALAEQEKEQP